MHFLYLAMSEDDTSSFRKYRGSTLGQTLGQTLLELIKEGRITSKEATRTLELFDSTVDSMVKADPVIKVESVKIEGTLDYFNCYSGLWHLRVKNVTTSLPSAERISSLCVLAEEAPKERKRKRV